MATSSSSLEYIERAAFSMLSDQCCIYHLSKKEKNMKLSRVSMIVMALYLVVLGLGFQGNSGIANALSSEPTRAAACGKCGDGQCVKTCGENEKTCPADCAVDKSKATTTAPMIGASVKAAKSENLWLVDWLNPSTSAKTSLRTQ